MKHEYKRLKNDVLYEQSQIEIVISDIQKLVGESTRDDMNRDQKTAIAGYLMNFYNGVENIMKRIAKDYYRKFPKGELWHKQLIKQSLNPPNGKEALFSKDVIDGLYDYLGFRHFFIHGYGFMLSWDKMEPLVKKAPKLWENIKEDINLFLEKLEA